MLSSDFRKRGGVTVFAVWFWALQVGLDAKLLGGARREPCWFPLWQARRTVCKKAAGKASGEKLNKEK